jgi:hypothetical protein
MPFSFLVLLALIKFDYEKTFIAGASNGIGEAHAKHYAVSGAQPPRARYIEYVLGHTKAKMR